LTKIRFEPLTVNSELAKKIPDFVVRPSQMEMAALIEEVINGPGHGIIEAGTGTGKTFAYLLPAIASGKRIIISTGTKNLQDQLFYQDIPLVNRKPGIKTALLKGRANYLCPHRLHKNLTSINRHVGSAVLDELVRVSDWSQQTRTGDLTELLDAGGAGKVVSLVTSTTDNCLGSECNFFDECPVYRARAQANSADLVVVNHHILFADAAMKEDSLSPLLRSAELIIVDEAHQVPDVARTFFGERISTWQLLELVRDVLAEQGLFGNDDPELIRRARLAEASVKDLVGTFDVPELTLDQLLHKSSVRDALEDVDVTLANLIRHLQHTSVRSAGFSNCYLRAMRLADLFTLLTEGRDGDDGYAHWIDRQVFDGGRSGFMIHLSPINIAQHLAPLIEDANRSWLFVSATLSVAESFDHFRASLGIGNVVEKKFESPFDFLQQVQVYVPEHLADPGNDSHTQGLLAATLPLIRASSGRTFFLFTSHRALRLAAELLQQEADIVFLQQGAMPKKLLLQKFREIPRCVLLATQSFWEGVDVKGADLRCLVIDKLPFSSPDNPMVQAQLRAIESSGENGFRKYTLPEAAISLKQGFGRLIRQESDRGLFVLGDTRINTRSYGKILKQSLPQMKWIQSQQQAVDYMMNLS